MKIVRITNRYEEVIVPQTELYRLSQDPSLLHLCTLSMLDGSMAFIRILELKYFTPGLPINDEYILHMFDFDGMPSAVVSIPMSHRAWAEDVARMLYFELDNKVPVMISAGGITTLPMWGERVLMLGKIKGSKYGPQEPATREAEINLIKGFEEEHQKWIIDQPQRWHDGRWWQQILPGNKPSLSEIACVIQQTFLGHRTQWYITWDQLSPEEKAKGYFPGGFRKA